MAAIALAWFVYDGLWQPPLSRRPALATALSLALAAAATFGFCRLLAGRAAFIHVGAMLGTLMVANVWVRILPAQQRMIDATASGRVPDVTEGDRAKRRSVHNSYMTFPVLFIMLSNHFPAIYSGPWNAVALVLLMVAGAAARHVMIGKGPGRRWALVPLAAALCCVLLITRPGPGLLAATPDARTPGPAPAFSEVQSIVQSRCGTCHSRTPSAAGRDVRRRGQHSAAVDAHLSARRRDADHAARQPDGHHRRGARGAGALGRARGDGALKGGRDRAGAAGAVTAISSAPCALAAPSRSRQASFASSGCIAGGNE